MQICGMRTSQRSQTRSWSTHGVAIANNRLIACDCSGVTFRWKNYRAEGPDRQKVITLSTGEFIRHFLIRDVATDHARQSAERMPNQFRESARRSRLMDRKAARRRRGLDGRNAVVTRIAAALPLGFIRLYCGRCHDLSLPGNFSACGVQTKINGN